MTKKLLAILIFLLITASAWAQAPDIAGSAYTEQASTSTTWTHSYTYNSNCIDPCRMLIIPHWNNPGTDVTGVTYGGETASLITQGSRTGAASVSSWDIDQSDLDNLTQGNSYDVVVTYSGSVVAGGTHVLFLSLASQDTMPAQNNNGTNSGGTTDVTISFDSQVPNTRIICGLTWFADSDTATPVSGFTELFDSDAGNMRGPVGHRIGGDDGSNYTVGFSPDSGILAWHIVCIGYEPYRGQVIISSLEN